MIFAVTAAGGGVAASPIVRGNDNLQWVGDGKTLTTLQPFSFIQAPTHRDSGRNTHGGAMGTSERVPGGGGGDDRPERYDVTRVEGKSSGVVFSGASPAAAAAAAAAAYSSTTTTTTSTAPVTLITADNAKKGE